MIMEFPVATTDTVSTVVTVHYGAGAYPAVKGRGRVNGLPSWYN